MGIDEVLEVATSLAGREVVIIQNDGNEIRGKLLRVGADDFQIELQVNGKRATMSLGDVNWLSRI